MKKLMGALRSRTMWVNGLSVLTMAVESQLGYLREAVPPEHWWAVMAGLAAVNIVLRTVTTQPLEGKADAGPPA